MGGGIGRCKVKNKTFSYEITKDAAEASLKAIKQGQTFTNVVATLLSTQVGSVRGVVISLTALKLTSPGSYERLLNVFLKSGRKKGKLYFETHCVNRGYIQGEPMYDYVVDKAYVK